MPAPAVRPREQRAVVTHGHVSAERELGDGSTSGRQGPAVLLLTSVRQPPRAARHVPDPDVGPARQARGGARHDGVERRHHRRGLAVHRAAGPGPPPFLGRDRALHGGRRQPDGHVETVPGQLLGRRAGRHLGPGVRVDREGDGRGGRAARGRRARLLAGGRGAGRAAVDGRRRGRGRAPGTVLLRAGAVGGGGDPAAAAAVALLQPGERTPALRPSVLPHPADRRRHRVHRGGPEPRAKATPSGLPPRSGSSSRCPRTSRRGTS